MDFTHDEAYTLRTAMHPRRWRCGHHLIHSHMIKRHRNPEHGHWITVLDDRGNEGGRGAVTDASQRSCPTDTGTVERRRPVPPHHHSASDVVSEPSAAIDALPDAVDEIPHGRTCPECNSPADRVRRRLVDRLVSWISPVHRYRCRMTGWGCDWEGNLRTKQGSRPKPAAEGDDRGG